MVKEQNVQQILLELSVRLEKDSSTSSVSANKMWR